MTFVITDPCIGTTDQSCVEVCPVDCINWEEGIDKMLYIDEETCIDCGACEPVCPVTAIYPSEDDVPDSQKVFIDINKDWYKDPDVVRANVEEHIATSPTMQVPPEERQAAH